MALDPENRYNKTMNIMVSLKKISSLIIISVLISSCASINNLMQSGDDEASSSEIKDISVNKRLQISIPIPDDAKYLTDKTIIFGEVERFTGVLYLIHETSADDVVAVSYTI